MGMLDWFKNLAAGKEPAASPPPTPTPPPAPVLEDNPEEGVVGGLNFKTAIDAHMQWKVRLEKYIAGTSEEDLRVDVISRDDRCVLGKWIHGPGGQNFGHLREFQEMKLEHARFHLCAGDVLSCAVAGDRECAEDKLRSGEYNRASERVKLHLARLYVQATQGRS